MSKAQTIAITLLAILFIVGCGQSNALKQQNAYFTGKWDYHVTDPAGEAYAGVLTLSGVDDTITGKISNDALSVEQPISVVSVDENQLSFAFDAGSYGEIFVSVMVDQNSMTGMFANEAIGQMPLEGLRTSMEVEITDVDLLTKQVISTDPDEATVHAVDISNFWEAFDEAGPDFNAEAFQELYLDRGSDGVNGFIRYRIQNAIHLANTVRENQEFYRSIREATLNLPDVAPAVRENFRTFKALYADAVFPDVYLVIGARNSGGTASERALIIGTEMYAESGMNLVPIICHELIHFQQKYGTTTLLEQTIKEGSADFLGELISGSTANEHLPAYADPREEELWNEFKEIMHDEDYHGWMYGDPGVEGRPADLAYWMGYKITKAYYDQAEDKTQAIIDIINLTDAVAFLEASGYMH